MNSNHQDHLGSTAVVTDSNGELKELLDYNPYGTERLHTGASSTSALPSDEAQKTYIGEYSDDDSGLSYLNARYYDAERGQFLSEDPAQWTMVEQFLTDPQQLNFYSYSRNNPVNLKDPTGHSSEESVWYNPFSWDWGNIGGNLLQTLDTVPVTGDVSDVYACLTGETLFTQESLTEEELGITAIMGILPIATGGEVRMAQQIGEAFDSVTVIGSKKGGYVEYAKNINANYFQISDGDWSVLNDSERWALNQSFLDDVISRGDTIKLSDTVKNVEETTGYFRKELDYLTEKGYALNDTGTEMIKK